MAERTILFNGLMYLFGSAAALFVPRSAGIADQAPKDGGWHPWRDLRLTTRYVVRERLLRRSILLKVAGNLVFAPLFFMAPLLRLH